jgi:GH15 family glucan-1,4-alpha-glucosidase
MIKEALSMLRMSLKRKTVGYKIYKGTPAQICRQIVDNCFNGDYFQVSAGHFDHFYVRDFAYCCDSLIICGYQTEVIKTIDFALSKFEDHGRFTTTITSNGPEDFFSPTPESLALMLRSIKISGYVLSSGQRAFIEKFAQKINDNYIDKGLLGLLRKDIWFSSIKDHAVRNSSAYDNSMLYLLSDMLDSMKLSNPFDTKEIKKAIIEELFNGKYFYDDMNRKPHISSDANIFPFWCGVIDSRSEFMEILQLFKKAKLEQPYPIKYTRIPQGKYAFPYSFLAPNYEGNTIWMHLGLVFIEVLHKFDKKKAQKYIDVLTGLVDRHKNFLELYNPDGTIYHTLLYSSDESMVWAVMLLRYLEKNG